ncbi:MAG: hypothetical protein V4739_18390 [Pseudomonadota bacterium]
MPELIRLLLLYAHLIAFALTVSVVVREDFRLLTQGFGSLTTARLQATSRTVVPGTAVLLATGLGLGWCDFGAEAAQWLAQPKLMAKLTVVAVLLLNGVLLHCFAFPALQRKSARPRRTAVALCLLGAVSSVSWLYISFLGVARVLADQLQWHEFMTGYLFLVSLAFAGSVWLSGEQLVRRLSPARARPPAAARKEPRLALAHDNH